MKQWIAFVSLSAIWGTSYMFIKIANEELLPFTLVTIRLGAALLGLALIIAVRKLYPPRDWQTLGKLLFLGMANTTLPFALITWGERSIDSGVTSVLLATAPLFTLIIAHFFLEDEKFTGLRIAGLLIGLGGVAVIFSEELLNSTTFTNPLASDVLLGQGVVVLASMCYAIGNVFTRKQVKHLNPITLAGGQVASAFLFSTIGMTAAEWPVNIRIGGMTLFAVLWLGLLGTCVAYLLYFYLIRNWGSTRSSLVTYLIPVISVTLGAIVLKEKIGWQLGAGFALIVSGIVLVNNKPRSS